MAERRKRHVAALGDIDAQVAKLLERKKDVLRKRAERIAKLAGDCGLAELDISDDELTEAFRELANRFQTAQKKQRSSPASD